MRSLAVGLVEPAAQQDQKRIIGLVLGQGGAREDPKAWVKRVDTNGLNFSHRYPIK